MRPTRSMAVRVIAALASASLLGGVAAWASDRSAAAPDDKAQVCTERLASDAHLSRAAHRRCVIAIAATYLDARQHTRPASSVPLDPRVAAYSLSESPTHQPGNAATVRRALRTDTTTRVGHLQWTVDGDVAFVAYAGWRNGGHAAPTYWVAQRFTLRRGLIWEVLSSADVAPSTGSGGFPNTPISVVAGPPAAMPKAADYSDASYCTVRIAQKGDASLTAAQHRSCMIAIATTYVDAEENSQPGNQILFDPRFSRYSLGGQPVHAPSNSDLIRTQEGTYQGTYNRVIRSIKHREWTVDGDQAWIAYQGWLVVSTTHPGFYVAERFTIRNGLIWNIMIAPIATAIP